MEEYSKKLGQFNMSLNSLETVPNDPTILKSDIVIFDFEKSGNNQIITKEVALDNMKFLIGKRLCCKYINKEDNDGLDALGTHEQYETTNRDGDDVVYTATEGIGFIEDVYIGTYVNDNDEEKEAVIGKCIFWADDHYSDIIGLLKQWLANNIKIHFSVEYYYFNYNVENGIEYIQSPIIFNALTALNSEDRGNAIEVLPAYDCATLTSFNELKDQWNKAINSLNKNEKENNRLQSGENLDSNKLKQVNNIDEKEAKANMENIFKKALNDISLGDLRGKILNVLGDYMSANEFEYMWLSNYGIFPEQKYFVYETYNQDLGIWDNYKVTYNVDENDNLTINYDSKQIFTGTWADPQPEDVQGGDMMENDEMMSSMNAQELEESKKALNEANTKIEELNNEIKSLNEKLVEKSNNAKVDTDKFEELTNKLVSLNSLVAEMQPIVDKYNQEVFEKSFNEAKESYKIKFTSVNALDVFEEESTQELIKESINSVKEKADKAKYSLNELIVNSIKPIELKVDEDDILANTAKVSINQVVKAEDTKELTDIEDNVLSEYGFNY